MASNNSCVRFGAVRAYQYENLVQSADTNVASTSIVTKHNAQAGHRRALGGLHSNFSTLWEGT